MENSKERNLEGWVEERLAFLDAGEWQPDSAAGLRRLRQRMQACGNSSRKWTLALAGVTAVVASALMLPAPRALAVHCVNCSMAFLQSLAGGGSTAADLTPSPERKMAPDFSLTDAYGKPVRLSDFRGKLVLPNFWATWCNPCAVEIPWFIELQSKYRDRLVVVGVSMDEDGWKTVKPFLEAKRVNYRTVIGNDKVAAQFGGVESLPTTLVIDRDGRIAASHVGLVAKHTYSGEIEALLGETGSGR